MKTLDLLGISVSSLTANPIRTFLTMLGVVIGVACVVSMVAIGAGAQARVADQIRAFGANVLLVNPGAANKNGVRGAIGSRLTLTAQDARAIAQLPAVTASAPSVYGAAQIVYGANNWSTTINGTTPDHFAIREWALMSGRPFSREDLEGAGKVAIIGARVAEQVFKAEEPLGKVVRIMSTPFTVIGVLASKGVNGSGQNQDDVAFVPLSTATLRLIGSANAINRDTVGYILASARSDGEMTTAISQIEDLLRQRHHTRSDDDDFTVTTAASALAAQEASTKTISILLGSIAAVSLIVGGISIMNIMLVSVTERTPEIGLRLAIGARPKDIRRQFLLEAIALCTTGGVIGVALGYGAAVAVATRFDWPILLQPITAFGAVALAGCVGMFFGWYPAWRAAALQPVTALRSL
jgi:putative ABC transport system permease protein